MNRSFLATVIFILLFAFCSQDETAIDEKDGLSAFSSDSLGKHIAELSGDDFTGRKPFSEGEQKLSIIQRNSSLQ